MKISLTGPKPSVKDSRTLPSTCVANFCVGDLSLPDRSLGPYRGTIQKPGPGVKGVYMFPPLLTRGRVPTTSRYSVRTHVQTSVLETLLRGRGAPKGKVVLEERQK